MKKITFFAAIALCLTIMAGISKIPIINAGDGEGEHPTQAILDLYTIFSKIKRPSFTVAMVGDLKYGRTIHSLSYFLSLYSKSLYDCL